MAMISWPFDSTVTADGEGNPIYNRAYSSDILANILRKYFRNGVFSDSTDCFQVVESSGMDILVSPGHCLIQGRHGYNEAASTLTISTANASLPRIDLVVLRLDLGVNALSITPAIVTGTAAITPVAPALTRNSTVYELSLAEIHVAAGLVAITQAVITDTRLDSDRCGVVASIIGETDTSTYYAQIAADLAEFKTGREADFDAWFSGIVEILDESTAGNLLNRILALETNVTVNTNTAPALATLAHNGEYRCTNGSPTTAPSMTLGAIVAVSDQFAASVIFKAPNTTAPIITNNSGFTLKYKGDDVLDGVFTPIVGTIYRLSFLFDGFSINCYVTGGVVMITVIPVGGAGISGFPIFTYTGSYSMIDDGDGNWRIKFLTSGTFTLTGASRSIDIFLVGGGGGGGRRSGGSNSTCGGGGGGGYTNTQSGLIAVGGNAYSIAVGAGGAGVSGVNANGGTGGTSSGFGYSANGGTGGSGSNYGGGNGGSGGGAAYAYGGANGANGTSYTGTGGTGQGSTTKEFAETAGLLYASGGNGYLATAGTYPGDGASITGGAGAVNSGAGGGGHSSTSYAGGSGIVVIRNHRT